MASNLDLGTFEDVDVLMAVDPILDYINDILMEEGMDDASFSQQVDLNSSYQAIFGSFQDILGALRASLPANGHLPGSFQQGMVLKRETSLLSGKDMATQNLHGLNGRTIIDAIVSSDKDIPIQKFHNSDVGLCMEQRNGKIKLPSAGEEFCSEVAELDLSFEDLKLDDVYTSLYVEEPRSSMLCRSSSRHNGDKQSFLAAKGRKFHGKRRSEEPTFEVLKEVLISCAQAVAIGDVKVANQILQEVCQVHGASADGTSLQRLAHYFSKALATRLRGMGHNEVEAMALDMPPAATVLRAFKVGYEVIPYGNLLYYFANQSILKVAEGASKLHILDYGLMYGMQWPCLINALADRKGGPPLLVITGIEFPQPGINMVERLDRSGRRLAAYAKTCNVPFQFHAIVTNKWEDLDAASLYCSESEVLVVNCMKCLRHVSNDAADSTLTTSPRQKLLTRMHSLSPHLVVTAVVSAALSSPYFDVRFREALYFYSSLSDMLDTLWGDMPERLCLERSWCHRDIMNIVACEGAERVERPATYKQWHAHITKAGFELLPIPSAILARSKAHVKQHQHKDFLIHDDVKGWILMGWKGRVMFAISAWKPCSV